MKDLWENDPFLLVLFFKKTWFSKVVSAKKYFLAILTQEFILLQADCARHCDL